VYFWTPWHYTNVLHIVTVIVIKNVLINNFGTFSAKERKFNNTVMPVISADLALSLFHVVGY